jgi:putative oxidoreductase
VDWKRLVQSALLGSSDWEQYAILLVRISLGLFFAISGANKLFVAGSAHTMYETLVKAKVPFPHLMIGRYACRHPDHQAFRFARRTFAS